MSEFNWDAFNKSLQGSTNICSGARADIDRAIKAGRRPSPAKLQVWRTRDGHIGIIMDVGGSEKETKYALQFLSSNAGDYDAWMEATDTPAEAVEDCEFLAVSLSEYLANGGTL